MPVIVANLLRWLFVGIVQTAAFVALTQFLERTVDYIRDTLKKDGKLGEGDIDDVMLNETISALAVLGITVASLKTKIPIRLADKLGLKGGRTQQTQLSTKAQAGVRQATSKGGLATSALRKFLIAGAGAFGASLFWLPFLVQQIADQASFAPRQANDFYEKYLGVRPFDDPKSGPAQVLSDDVLEKVFTTYQTAKAVGINDMEALQTLPFTKANLTKVTNKIASDLLLASKQASAKNVIDKLQGLVIFPGGKSAPTIALGGNTGSATGSISQGVAVTFDTPRVYTGIVSQGVVSQGLNFTPRPDDLIESLEEFRQAASNNLVSYLSALPGKIVYEAKIVPSVITKDGFKQTGTAQKIQTGTYSNGTPKYKTVVNKFAVMDVFAVTDKGTRTKLTRIVLGPTDSARLQVAENDLRSLEAALPNMLTTKSLPNSKEVVTDGEVTISEEQKAPTVAPTVPQEGLWLILQVPDGQYQRGPYPDKKTLAAAFSEAEQAYRKLRINTGMEISDKNPGLPVWKGVEKPETVVAKAPKPDADPVVSAPVEASMKPLAGATTLLEWYQAQGLSLPSVQERSLVYQGLGLGQASYYTGTTEQNTKLLNALKEKQN